MGLLGKTLKGRTTRPGGIPPVKNIKIRQIAKTHDEFNQLKELAKIKRDILRAKIKNEHKFVNFNKKKLLTYWRKIMRIAKTEELKNEIDIYSQNNQRQLDSKEAFIQMIDKNLDEAEDQYQMALLNHLIHIENLTSVQEARIRGLQEEFKRDVSTLETEYSLEREQMERTHKNHIKQLEDMIDTVKEEDKKKLDQTKSEEQAFREEIKNKNIQDQNHMKLYLQSKQTKYFTELEQMSQKYTSDTQKRTGEHSTAYEYNLKTEKNINELNRKIATKKVKIDQYKLKILQHKKECSARNTALKKQKDNISKNYQELKLKMTKFRDEEEKRLKELTNNSRNAVERLKQYETLGEKILKTAELCRRHETEKQKVLPFFQGSVEESEIPQDFKQSFTELTPEQYEEFRYLNNFYKRYNKVLLDKLVNNYVMQAIEKQKDGLQKDNVMLKSLLKQYLDGISLNDEVLRNINPLLVVNYKINISKLPVEKQGKTTVIEGNAVVNNAVHQLGYVPRMPFQ